MDPRFAGLVETLAPKLERLVAMNPLQYGQLPLNMPEKGVYPPIAVEEWNAQAVVRSFRGAA